ncbi:MAG: hypothetical protein ACW974_04790 [Candidatus Thorarchaeota archaeon]|jgi:uncharacterized membrane protein
MENRFSNRTLIVILIMLTTGWLIAQIITGYLFPASPWPFSLPAVFIEIVFIAVLMGFIIYGQRLRDERTMRISNQSARNGFAFIFYTIPIAIIGLSATEVSTDVSLALMIIWIGAVSFAGISALYYYQK